MGLNKTPKKRAKQDLEVLAKKKRDRRLLARKLRKIRREKSIPDISDEREKEAS